jgi:chemotaxis protein CheD
MYLASPEAIEIFLQPGDFYFGDEHTRIRTLLGSCVAITIWHPRLKQGGMCHYMLPEHTGRGRKRPDGRYADDVMVLFMRELAANKTLAKDYEVKLFGGGRMFLNQRKGKVIEALDIGLRNIEAGRRLLREHGFHVKAEHLAGDGHRNVIFDVATGDVWVRHVPELAISNLPQNRVGGGS